VNSEYDESAGDRRGLEETFVGNSLRFFSPAVRYDRHNRKPAKEFACRTPQQRVDCRIGTAEGDLNDFPRDLFGLRALAAQSNKNDCTVTARPLAKWSVSGSACLAASAAVVGALRLDKVKGIVSHGGT